MPQLAQYMELDYMSVFRHRLENVGCVVLQRGQNRLEIWEAHVHEHYLVTLDRESISIVDVIQLVN